MRDNVTHMLEGEATVFWDQEGVLLVDFLEGRKTVTGLYYIEVFRKLRTELA